MRNKQRPPTIARHKLRAANIAYNAPDRPLLAVRQSDEFVRWCLAQGLTGTRKRAARFLRLKEAQPASGGVTRSFSGLIEKAVRVTK